MDHEGSFLQNAELLAAVRNASERFFNEPAQYEEIKRLVTKEKRSRYVLDVGKLNSVTSSDSGSDGTINLGHKLLAEPFTYLFPIEEALQSVVASIITGNEDNMVFESEKEKRNCLKARLGIKGWLGASAVSPRGLSSRLINMMVSVEGIISKYGELKPKLSESVFFIPDSNRTVTLNHADGYLQNGKFAGSTGAGLFMKFDRSGNPIEQEVGLSVYRDFQRITLQEMPEVTPSGWLPCSIDVILQDDLACIGSAKNVKPGDRVRVTGIYKAMVEGTFGGGNGAVSGYAKGILIANHIEQRNPAVSDTAGVSAAELKAFKEIAKRKDLLDLLARSLAPSICGHLEVKKGLALIAVGGNRKSLEQDGTNLRGDIHILLVGDPSCGKSQLLRYMMMLSPIAVSTTGRGSSAVGLTAAVTLDPDTQERRLEAGAMVVADGGLVCIDEFDKMSSLDRAATHEVMEQQTVSVSKAGIQATLNARTSVLAAANPCYGVFDDSAKLQKQISFPDSILSRFDLIYIIRDSATEAEDSRIASQVLAQFRIQPGGSAETGGSSAKGNAALTDASSSFGAYHPVALVSKETVWVPTPLGVALSNTTTLSKKNVEFKCLSMDFLKKYFAYCKLLVPKLTDKSASAIASFYVDLRSRFGVRTVGGLPPPTTRTLEAAIRLATAHAKLRMSKTVDLQDVNEAQQLLLWTLCGEKVVTDDGGTASGGGNGGAIGGNGLPQAPPSIRSNKRRRGNDQQQEQQENDDMNDNNIGSSDCLSAGAKRTAIPDSAISSAKRKNLITPAAIEGAIAAERKDQLLALLDDLEVMKIQWSSDDLFEEINRKMKLSQSEFDGTLVVLQRENRLMRVANYIFFI